MGARRSEDGGNVLVASFAGKALLDFETMKAACEDLFRQMNEQGCRKLVLSFRGVRYLSSQALGPLLTLDKKLRRVGSPLVLCSLDPQVYEIFEVTKLDRWFTISEEDFDAEHDAVAAPLPRLEPSDEEPVILPFPPKGGDQDR
jgi:anti-sigma B factor antagonist